MTTQPPSWYPPQTPGAEASGHGPYPGYPVPPSAHEGGPWSPYPGAGFGGEGPPLPPPPAPTPGRGRDWRIVAAAIAAVLVALAGVLVGVLGTSSATPRARLESAILATDSAVTADMTLDVKVALGGFSFDVKATGVVDFATNAARLHMNAFGQTVSVISTGGNVYVRSGTLVSRQFPGKTWLEIPISQMSKGTTGSRLFLTDDPAKVMDTLVKLGGTVTQLGATTIDGSQDQGYRVDFTLATLEAHASELPPSLRSLFANTAKLPKTMTLSATLYVDPAGQLQGYDLAFSAQATGHQVTGSVDLTLSHFGSATPPSPPPAGQTVPYSQFQGTGSTTGASTLFGGGVFGSPSSSGSGIQSPSTVT